MTKAIIDWLNVLWKPVQTIKKISQSTPVDWRWKWAVIILIGIELTSQFIVFNQPKIFEQAKEAHIKASDEKMKADGIEPLARVKAVEAMEDKIQPVLFIVMNSGRAIVETAARFAMMTAGFWILLRVVLNQFPSLAPSLEAVGLSTAPLALGLLAKLATVIITQDLTATPSASLFFKFSDALNIGNVFMSLLNPFYIWTCFLMANASIQIWKTNPGRTFFWFYAGWVIVTFGFSFLQKSISLRGV